MRSALAEDVCTMEADDPVELRQREESLVVGPTNSERGQKILNAGLGSSWASLVSFLLSLDLGGAPE